MCRNARCTSFLFITIQICSFSLSCDLLKISLILPLINIIRYLKDTKSLGNNKAPACESRGFVRKKQKVCILTHLLFLYNKNQRNFPQDWEKLLTRFAASCNKISGIPVSCVFLCSFLWAYSSSGGKYAPPEELPQKSFRSFSLSANCLFMGFPAEGLALKILQPGIYSFSRHIRFFSYGCVLSGIFQPECR